MTSTGYYYQCLRVIAKTAELLGKPQDEARHYKELAEQVRGAFNATFFNANTAQYANATQTALPALYQGLRKTASGNVSAESGRQRA